MTTAAVVLAAGASSRFAGPEHKLLTPFRGRPLVTWAIAAAAGAHLDATYVVTGAVDLTGVVPPGVVVVANPNWAEGQATSLRAAWARAGADGHDAIVVGLGDSPFTTAEAWRAVAACTATPIAAADYGGALRTPVRLAAEVWPLLPDDGDEGARTLLRMRPELVTAVPCSGEPHDIDTLEDLERWS